MKMDILNQKNVEIDTSNLPNDISDENGCFESNSLIDVLAEKVEEPTFLSLQNKLSGRKQQ